MAHTTSLVSRVLKTMQDTINTIEKEIEYHQKQIKFREIFFKKVEVEYLTEKIEDLEVAKIRLIKLNA